MNRFWKQACPQEVFYAAEMCITMCHFQGCVADPWALKPAGLFETNGWKKHPGNAGSEWQSKVSQCRYTCLAGM
jgi:hypothetical protein